MFFCLSKPLSYSVANLVVDTSDGPDQQGNYGSCKCAVGFLETRSTTCVRTSISLVGGIYIIMLLFLSFIHRTVPATARESLARLVPLARVQTPHRACACCVTGARGDWEAFTSAFAASTLPLETNFNSLKMYSKSSIPNVI